jgi:hypothetical protein
MMTLLPGAVVTAADEDAGFVAAGPGGHCSPCHRVPFNLREEGSKCV